MIEDSTEAVISVDQQRNFIDDGYVIIRNVFDPEIGAEFADRTWKALGEDPSALSQDFLDNPQLEDVIEEGSIDRLITPRLCRAVDELLGAGRWWTRQGCGWVTVRAPVSQGTPWQAPETGWHVDGIHFHHYLTSPEQGLVGIEMLTDSHPQGGATMVRRGSHQAVARALYKAGERGMSYPQMRGLAESLTEYDAVEATGAAGDVLLMHPHLVHARSMNSSDQFRLAANRCFALHAPKTVTGQRKGGFSVMEQAIRMAIGAD